MKFEFNKEKYVDLGLIVKHGNMQNIVMFWDENAQAMSYILEIYRIDWNYENECFFEEATVKEQQDSSYNRVAGDKSLSIDGPAVVSMQFAAMREWVENYRYNRSEVTFHDFGQAKPVCTVAVDRNKFYHSINDLPCGDYIVCFKVEDRSGEICAQSAPYYFHINDAEEIADERAQGIANASRASRGSCLG